MLQPILPATRGLVTDPLQPPPGEAPPLSGERTMPSDACLFSAMGAAIGAQNLGANLPNHDMSRDSLISAEGVGELTALFRPNPSFAPKKLRS